MASIEFWFDFSSPYAYLAAQRIETIAVKHRRALQWRPTLLGAIFKATGGRPLVEQGEAKAAYARHDFARSARRLGVGLRLPTPFPFASIAAVRAFYWLEATDGDKAGRFVRQVFAHAFDPAAGDGTAPVSAAQVAAVAAPLGVDPAALTAAVENPVWKDRVRQAVDDALEVGVFGAPFMRVDGEPFWGADRIDEFDQWLTSGGW